MAAVAAHLPVEAEAFCQPLHQEHQRRGITRMDKLPELFLNVWDIECVYCDQVNF